MPFVKEHRAIKVTSLVITRALNNFPCILVFKSILKSDRLITRVITQFNKIYFIYCNGTKPTDL